MAIQTKNRVDPFQPQLLDSIAKILGATDTGMTGTEIGHWLTQCGIPDPDPAITKWRRLYNALAVFQNEHQVGNHVVKFVTAVMNPAMYTARVQLFEDRRAELNRVLSLCGMELGDDGKMRRVSRAVGLSDAVARSSRLKSKLEQRGCHAEVFKYCSAEIVAENCFHAVFEGTKSIAGKLRQRSGSTDDGAALVDAALGSKDGKNPAVMINKWDTETLRGEQRGFATLLKGVFGTFRNPLAHEPKIQWEMSEQDALDILTMLSYAHRKLDKSASGAFDSRPAAS